MTRGVVMFDEAGRPGTAVRNVPLMLGLERVAEERGIDLVELARVSKIGWDRLRGYVEDARREEPDLKSLVRLCAVLSVSKVDDLPGMGYRPRSDMDRRLIELQMGSREFARFSARMRFRLGKAGLGIRLRSNSRPLVRSFDGGSATIGRIASKGARSLLRREDGERSGKR